MLEKLKKMISSSDADYVDIRYEVKKETNGSVSGPDLKSAGSNTTDGYVVRALKRGGFSSVTVTREEDVSEAVKLAVQGAEAMSGQGKTVSLAPVEPVQDWVEPELDIDPASLPMKEKLLLLNKYNDIMFSFHEIVNTNLSYSEVDREKFFVSSQGSAIRERVCTVSIGGEAVARKGVLTQNIRIAIGGAHGFRALLNRDDVFRKRAELCEKLLDAKPVKAGTYDVIINPGLTGVFIHEAFGHFSEADIIEDNPPLRARMALGEKIGSDAVTIVADTTLPNQVGFYRYDDEGTPVRPVTLMEKGVLKARLHSRRTAAEFGEPVTGHAVAEDHRFEPIVRMGTIYMQKGSNSFEWLLNELGDGLYICDGKGGQTSGENFTFGAQYGYEVKDGEIKGMIRDINIMGNMFTTMKNIEAMDNEMKFAERGGCGKGQLNIKSGYGGPSVLIRSMVIGGA
ncbi:MAG TPA: TldD/PmbA family protein [Candidatus Sabulitectum sp.]|nr:TldD/PmbA family protein [Candidatus Sabulitectum sp.]HPJ27420.1 TldD/PmbA family protein [Candidatus Sabulitectum sp.]HPR21355.1 TldD/PmbA family protein [Candidatus Sabulitectum sp.]